MSQCLHCGKPCTEHAVFCDDCQRQARELFQPGEPEQFACSAGSSPFTPTTFASSQSEEDGPLGTITVPFEPSDSFADISALTSESGLSSVDEAVSRLSEAARLIAAEDASESRLKRLARLLPLRDISADIQRASTPHPRLSRHGAFDTIPGSGAGRQGGKGHAPAVWPWFGEDDEEVDGVDAWANATDPLLARSRPAPGEASSIEAAQMRRIQMEEHETLPYPAMLAQKRRLSRWHVAFAVMVVLAVVALAVDGLLLSFAFHRANHPALAQSGPPTLLLSANTANPGSTISVQLANFVPTTSVALTHDVQEILPINGDQAALTINASGRASASFSVDTSWEPGFHLIVAEDMATRDTASAMLQVVGEGPSRPPHLLVDNSSLDLGDAVQGADTIQPLELSNSGSGSISWSASSDKPWLLVAPMQGVFSAGQSIAVAAQRNNLSPGDYVGTITLFSTVGAPETIEVQMKVSALPPNAGPMISLSPPLLAFTTADGSALPQTQVVTLSNPGQQTLFWSLNIGQTTATTMQGTSPSSTASVKATQKLYKSIPWLSANVRAGKLAPGASTRIAITARGQSLLPGAYMVPLSFGSTRMLGAYDNPQIMDVSLTVQPRCGLLTSTGMLSFTAVVGQSNPSSHSLGLDTTASCGSETLNWRALSFPGWLSVSPQSGQINSTTSGVTSISVNTEGLTAKKYTGLITFQAGKSTQTVVVDLNLQPHPAPSEPIMGASPLSLNFTTIQGQANPSAQVVTITNNGGSVLNWHTSVVQLGTSWLSVTPSGGAVPAGGTGQATVNVATSNLTPGTYTGQVVLAATDARGAPASGSPQTVTISLTVQPPCVLAQPSSSALLFNATAGGANPLAQTVTLTSSGSCVWPVHISTSVAPAASWLTLSAPVSALNTLSQQASISVAVNASGLQPGTYVTQVAVSAVDSAGTMASGSPQAFSVTLTVLQPCTLQALSPITLNAAGGQTTAVAQTLTLSETGSCNGGVSWTATGDAKSSSWLTLSATSGTDNGNGSSVTVSASARQLTPGTYSGQITVSANNQGVVLQGSPQTVNVTFHVSGYAVSGSIAACSGPAPGCATSQGLAGATVALVNGNGNTVATVTADASGNFTFTNVLPGTYTISATGSANSLTYSGTAAVTVGGNVNNVSVSTFSA